MAQDVRVARRPSTDYEVPLVGPTQRIKGGGNEMVVEKYD